MLPVIIPTEESLRCMEPLFLRAVEIRKHESNETQFSVSTEEDLRIIEDAIDEYVDGLYLINTNN